MRLQKCLKMAQRHRIQEEVYYNSTLFLNVYNKLYQLRPQLLHRFLTEKKKQFVPAPFFFPHTQTLNPRQNHSANHTNAHKPMAPVSLWLCVLINIYLHLTRSNPEELQYI